MDKSKLIKVTNRSASRVGYTIPELGLHRVFAVRETKEIEFGELEKLTWVPGGVKILSSKLVIKDEEAAKALLSEVEPEYFYDEAKVKDIMLYGSLDAFLDMLDFAPDGVLQLIKTFAVELPLNDVSKRKAILEVLDFDVDGAIKVKETPYDGGDPADDAPAAPKRRVQAETTNNENKTGLPVRRVPTNK